MRGVGGGGWGGLEKETEREREGGRGNLQTGFFITQVEVSITPAAITSTNSKPGDKHSVSSYL